MRRARAWIAWPLRQLDPHELDAEQQLRIQRIVGAFFDAHASSPAQRNIIGREVSRFDVQQIVVQLAGDPAAWLVLLKHPDESIRRTAARQLMALLGEPIAVDPAADPETQKSQRKQLRAKFQALKRSPTTEPKIEAQMAPMP